MILPVLGGTPAVWNTCMVFFQACLLTGYAYAHAIGRGFGLNGRWQTVLHGGVLLVPLVALPIRVADDTSLASLPSRDPTAWLLGRLLVGVGLPFFVVSTTSPLLQRWFSKTGHAESSDPYFLYVASNAGSIMALLAYPFLIEPNVGLSNQSRIWSWGYLALVALCAVSAAWLWGKPKPAEDRDADPTDLPAEPVTVLRWATWCALAFVPSSLMLGVTTYLSTDISSGPMLWIIPLSLYLLSFILTFSRREWLPHALMTGLLPFTTMILVPVLAAGLVWKVLIPVHLLNFFLVAMVCHGTLARLRPGSAHLTSFYLAVSFGGVLGGAFNALVAPLVFQTIAEYPLVLILACFALPRHVANAKHLARSWAAAAAPAIILLLTAAITTGSTGSSGSTATALATTAVAGILILACVRHRRRPISFALSLGAVLLGTSLTEGVNGRLLHRERDFFGVVRVTETADASFHRLFHGSTLHGEQSLEPKRRREPLTYFTPSGPMGQLIDVLNADASPARIAVAGLGVGSLASYARPSDDWVFYEIDAAVDRIARDPQFFTYIRDSQAASLEIRLGDARRSLAADSGVPFRMLILDAFSSDAVPIHLMTREALQLYLRRLAPGGIIAFNLSSRYVDLEPVVGVLAKDAGLVCLVRADTDVPSSERKRGKQPSIWAVMARSPTDLRALNRDPRWHSARAPSGEPVWTDDYSNLARHFILGLR
jgi:hypothetical protein